MAISKYQNIDWTTGVTAVDNIAAANIQSIDNIATPSGPPPTNWRSTIYTFDTQPTQTGAANDWAPDAAYTADGWVNGQACIQGTQWTPGINAKGWNCDFGSTPSSNTGPGGAMTDFNNPAVTSISTRRYVYKEASSGRNTYDHVARTPGYNFSTLMTNTSNNLRLVIWHHAYTAPPVGWQDPLFEVYADTLTTTTKATSTFVFDLPVAGNTNTGFTDPWKLNYVDLNGYRTANQTYYFYINMGPQNIGTVWQHDMALDSIYFEEY